MGISALHNGYRVSIMQIISYIMKKMLFNIWIQEYSTLWLQIKIQLIKLMVGFCFLSLVQSKLALVSQGNRLFPDPLLHSAAHTVLQTQSATLWPPFDHWFTELLKLDLKPRRWKTRLWHGCHCFPHRALKPAWSGIKCQQTFWQCADRCCSAVKEQQERPDSCGWGKKKKKKKEKSRGRFKM